jgi:hypothetical protein
MRRAGRLILAAALAAGMSGCAEIQERAPVARTPAPVPSRPAVAAPASPQKVVRVLVPKPVKCVPEDIGPPPAYPDSDAALRQAGGAADRYQLMAAGRILRQERLQKLEEAVRRCRNVGR